MQKAINRSSIKAALTEQGLTQKQLAVAVGVSSQAVTNWLKGKDFPRPATLLKLASTLHLSFEKMVQADDVGRPIVAFRKKGSAKTTNAHINKAEEMGILLKPLVPYLPEQQALRTLITTPSTEYDKLQTAVLQTRNRLGIGEQAVLGYESLIGEFRNSGAVLVPVMWGAKKRHENAIHIRLPKEDVTFILLNLDTRIEDFKFWMSHELAHVYTPELAGSEEGEDYADAFAGALLFPAPCAEECYKEASKKTSREGVMRALLKCATKHLISLNTIYQQVKQYAKANGLPALVIDEHNMHATRNSLTGTLISEALYDPAPPIPGVYIASCEHTFQSDFFRALKQMLQEQETGPPYLQQILDMSIHDAKSLYEELRH